MVEYSKLKEWQKFSDISLWNSSKPRISFMVLYRQTRQGGIGFPDLKAYYEATQLANLVKLSDSAEISDWSLIERPAALLYTLVELMWVPVQHQPLSI